MTKISHIRFIGFSLYLVNCRQDPFVLFALINDFCDQPSGEIGEAEFLELAFLVQGVDGFEGFRQWSFVIRRVEIQNLDAIHF